MQPPSARLMTDPAIMTRAGKAHVWMYWEDLPGEHMAPYLELCLDTIKLHLDDGMRLHALNEQTVFQWLPDLAPEIWTKLGTPVRRADYARVRLVERYGGLWIDADCIAVTSLRSLVERLATHEVVGWGTTSEDASTTGCSPPGQRPFCYSAGSRPKTRCSQPRTTGDSSPGQRSGRSS